MIRFASRLSLLLFLPSLLLAKERLEGKDKWAFDPTKLSETHLSFSPNQWQAIKPAEPARRDFFDPGAFLAPIYQRALDSDKDGQITRAEFLGTFARWAQEWDTKKQGFLDGEAMREGASQALVFTPGEAPPPPPPGGGGLAATGGQRNGMSGQRGVNFEYVHGDLELDGHKFADVAVRYKGNGTYMDARNSEKKSIKVDLNEFVPGQKLGGMTRLNFHNNLADSSWMNETLAHELYREAGVPSLHTSYTRLFVTVPGTFEHQYLGLYSICENPDNSWAETSFGTKKGLLLKPSTRELFIDKGDNWSAYAQAYDAKTDITEKQVRRVIEFSRLLTTGSDEEFAAQLPEYLDIDEWSRFMAVTVWLTSTDSILMLGQNYLVYLHPKTRKFQFIPWDLDRAFGNFFFSPPEELSIRQAWGEDNRFLSRVMKVPAVQEAYLARLREFQETIFQPAKLQQRVNELSAVIRPAVTEEGPEKLQRFETALSTQAPAAPPEAARPFGFDMGPKQIRRFIEGRHQAVAAQLVGTSPGKPLSGGGPGPFGGGPGRPGGPGNQRPGLGVFLGPALLRAADADSNGQVSPEEFSSLARRWFTEWDGDADGSLTPVELQAGIRKAAASAPPPRN